MLIGLIGKAGAGKDTVADYLVKEHEFKRYAFADAVRDVALAINPILDTPRSDYKTLFSDTDPFRLSDAITAWGWDRAKREIPEVRRLLQVIGTEAGRQVLGTNVWVDLIKNKYYEDGCPDAVITDMRFANEFKWVRQAQGYTVKIERPDNPNAIVSAHASEQYDPDTDFVIINDGTIADLEFYAKRIINLVGPSGKEY